MTHRAARTPSYRLHKPTGQAVVTLSGRDLYLGKHGTRESRARYDRLVAEWLANRRRLACPTSQAPYTMGQLCDEFLTHAEREYRGADGTQSREVANVRLALRGVIELFFDLDAEEFGPKSLVLYRERQIAAGLARKTINQRVGIVRRAIRWAVREEKVSPSGTCTRSGALLAREASVASGSPRSGTACAARARGSSRNGPTASTGS